MAEGILRQMSGGAVLVYKYLCNYNFLCFLKRFFLFVVFLLAYAVFVCRNTLYIMARRIMSLDDDAIRAMLEQKDESDEEIGGEENDDEERVVNESDHSTDSEIDGDQLQNSDRSPHSESSDEDDENYYL